MHIPPRPRSTSRKSEDENALLQDDLNSSSRLANNCRFLADKQAVLGSYLGSYTSDAVLSRIAVYAVVCTG